MGFLHEATNWVLLSFLIFAGVFFARGWKIVLGKLDAGIDKIRGEITSAEKLRRETEDLLNDYREHHRKSMNEAKDIAARARVQAEALREKAEADLRDTLARREKNLQERLTRIEQAAESELRAMTADLALKASETLIRKGLDAKGQAALADKSITALADAL